MNQPTTLGCSQCGKVAIFMLGDHPICIDCHYKFQQAQWMQFAQNAAMLNMLDKELTDSVGMPHLSNQIKSRQQP